MFAPDAHSRAGLAAGVAIAHCRADVTELAALRDRMPSLEAIAGRRCVTLPPTGQLLVTADTLVLSVRPARWLLVTAPAPAGSTAAAWRDLCAGTAAAVDQSSALSALLVVGPLAREALARGCRLDLAPDSFPPGRVAATIMAQVATILAALPAGILILTPAGTARHLREWLETTARPFGLAPRADVTVSTLLGHHDS